MALRRIDMWSRLRPSSRTQRRTCERRSICGLYKRQSDCAFLTRNGKIYRDPVHDFGFFRYDPSKVRMGQLAEIPLAPENARVGVEIRVVGNDAGEHVRANYLCFYFYLHHLSTSSRSCPELSRAWTDKRQTMVSENTTVWRGCCMSD